MMPEILAEDYLESAEPEVRDSMESAKQLNMNHIQNMMFFPGTRSY